MTTPGEDCVLAHPVFTAFGPALFRRAENDGVPVMVVPMGAREAVVPLKGLQREFGISEESDDGRMLELIAASLDFVSSVQLGEPLPTEVLTGEASWQPDDRFRELAANRLRVQLMNWLNPDTDAVTAEALGHLDEDRDLRRQVQTAFERAAEALGLPDSQEVVRLLELLSEELAYIEALRAGLLERVRSLVARLTRLGRGLRGDRNRMETLTQVQRLTTLAAQQIGSRFDQVDAQTGEVLSALRNIESQQAFIRINRDFLYRSLRAWETVLKEWDSAGMALDETVWQTIARTYQFLAPRYMPVKEWCALNRLTGERRGEPSSKVMHW